MRDRKPTWASYTWKYNGVLLLVILVLPLSFVHAESTITTNCINITQLDTFSTQNDDPSLFYWVSSLGESIKNMPFIINYVSLVNSMMIAVIVALALYIGVFTKQVHKRLEKQNLHTVKYHAYVEQTMDALIIHNLKGQIIDVNERTIHKLQLSREVLLKMTIGEILPRYEAETRDYWSTWQVEHSQVMETNMIGNHKKELNVEVSMGLLVYGNTQTCLVVARDITKRKRAQEKIQKLAYLDTLTGLPNSVSFANHVRNLLHIKDSSGALFFIDIDDFNDINDFYGHSFGDIVLQNVAKRLQTCIGKQAYVARGVGDEFTLCIYGVTDQIYLAAFAKKLIKCFEQPLKLSEDEVFMSCSIGIVRFPNDGQTQEDLISKADIAMHKVKKASKGAYKFYNQSMTVALLRRNEIMTDLRRGLESYNFCMYYQPILDIESGQITSLEALVRWYHPEKGFISPAEFIPIAESSGLILPLSKWIFEAVFKQMNEWYELGLLTFKVAINISSIHLQNEHFIDELSKQMQAYSISADKLILEITETVFIDFKDENLNKLHILKNNGIEIALDDFGTGYSSLNYIRYLPANIIKIDRSFIQEIYYCNKEQVIIEFIIALAHKLGLRVVAEGVETEAQSEFLKVHQCDELQGYAIFHPAPANEITELLLKKTKTKLKIV